jgi:hypothetical protein
MAMPSIEWSTKGYFITVIGEKEYKQLEFLFGCPIPFRKLQSRDGCSLLSIQLRILRILSRTKTLTQARVRVRVLSQSTLSIPMF